MSESYSVQFGLFDAKENKQLIALGVERELKTTSFEALNEFVEKHADEYRFGFLSYDVKNNIEALASKNKDFVCFPELFFFVPEVVVKVENSEMIYLKGKKNAKTQKAIVELLNNSQANKSHVQLRPQFDKKTYLEKVQKLLDHIQRGDVYEVTFCQCFYAENAFLHPKAVFRDVIYKAQAPFSCFVQLDDKYLISASPERFIKKTANTILSQPIKGTARRGKTTFEDEHQKEKLKNSRKERAENVMIVDLVRNDLSRIARKHSVKVDELFGIYTFPTVHQMISTVSAELKPGVSFEAILRALFPMGSMTGAPKISAMQLIEKHENFKRGLFSGSVGYIKPNGDFDFNVIIRSILYNATSKNLICPVGGAITIQSNPEGEYEECLLKMEALAKILNADE